MENGLAIGFCINCTIESMMLRRGKIYMCTPCKGERGSCETGTIEEWTDSEYPLPHKLQARSFTITADMRKTAVNAQGGTQR